MIVISEYIQNTSLTVIISPDQQTKVMNFELLILKTD